LQQLYAITGWSSIFRLRSVRQPTLVLAGDQDPLIPVCTTRVLGRAIPGARVTLMRGAGHSILLFDRAGEAGRVVEEFLARLDGQSRPALSVAAVS
jgi:pimeloyl-ACP methyl ester carboxylesterase